MEIESIETPRFVLKILSTENVNEKYLSWFEDNEIKKYILSAKNKLSKVEIQNFVEEQRKKNDSIFLGIFLKNTNEHIGNIKYAPIDFQRKTAVMGILIGESEWRGKGVAKEVIEKSSQYLIKKMGIEKILLSVDRGNQNAIWAYQKIGFSVDLKNILNPNGGSSQTMIWEMR